MKPEEIMLDLETMSSKKNAAITAIGAVKMDLEKYRITSRFYVPVKLASSVQYGLHMDPGTVTWWMQQADEARKHLWDTTAVNLPTALREFGYFCSENPVWGNGATFDNVILRNAYEAIGSAAPWGHREESCYRTLKRLYPAAELMPPPNDQKHNAIADAEWQALHLFNILKVMRNEA